MVVREHGVNKQFLESLAQQISVLQDQGVRSVLVGSGAIALGKFMGVEENKEAAFLGQKSLLESWSEAFGKFSIRVFERLLVDHNFNSGRVELCNDFMSNLNQGIFLLNGDDTRLKENDKARNNDYIVAEVGDLLDAQIIVNLTNVDGVLNRDGEVIKKIDSEDQIDSLEFGSKSNTGTGGMGVKLREVYGFTKRGKNRMAYIANGNRSNVLLELLTGQSVGTLIRTNNI